MKYEDLAHQPMQQIYRFIGIDFNSGIADAFTAQLQTKQNYKVNQNSLSAETVRKVRCR